MRERLIQLLSRYFNIGDSYTYNLTRVKSAFAVGTVDLDDFEEYTEDDVTNLADYLLDNGVIVPQVKVGQTVWLIEEGDEATTPFTLEVYVTAIGYDIGGFWLTMNLPLGIKHRAYVGETFFGKTVFFTREAAEEALKARGRE